MQIIVVQLLDLSLINYCIRMWGTTNKTILNAAQKLQNFAAKVATGDKKIRPRNSYNAKTKMD